MIGSFAAVVILLAALGGIGLASYIRYKKTRHEVLTCPLGSNCETVTHSEFSRFLGIPVEILGIIYYTLVTIATIVVWVLGTPGRDYPFFFLFLLSFAAFLFSLYLMFIQLVTLTQWCLWCTVSATLCALVFMVQLTQADNFRLLSILADNYRIILGVHLLGIALGLGGASFTDLFFFKFLKDWRISQIEADTMRILSQVIWCGIIILVISGIGLYLPQSARLNTSSKFLIKVTAVAVIIVNGAFLNLFITPRLTELWFGRKQATSALSLRVWRRVAFALGSISFASWYSAFLLGMIPSLVASYGFLLKLYGLALILAIIGSQVVADLLRFRDR